ncbi:MAG: FmdB family transcriptional regulator [Candidatus Dormibacteraeota bacterium]|nr:FmdB family transcriptional regulator [Candidatus Dormibacteraeota bacterium]
MPIYGYQCGRCGHQFEVMQSMSAAPLKDCPQCGGELRKLLYPVGVQFKGSGFYTTDYRNGGGNGSKKSSKSSESESSSSSSSSSKDSSSGAGSDSSSSSKTTETSASKE